MSENQTVLNYREQYAKAWTLPKPSKVNALKSLEELCRHIPEADYAAEAQYRSLLRYFQASPSKSTPKTLPEWASLFRSTDKARHQRQSLLELHVSATGCLEATCGHVAIQVPGYPHPEGYVSFEMQPIAKPDNFPNFDPILQGGETKPEIKFAGLESLEVGTLDDTRPGVKHSGLVFRFGNKWIQKPYLEKILAGSKLVSLEFRGDAEPLNPLFFFGCREVGGTIRGAVMPIRHEA